MDNMAYIILLVGYIYIWIIIGIYLVHIGNMNIIYIYEDMDVIVVFAAGI
jgi:hypothetical protein